MDVLKNPVKKSYEALSRYATVKYYYNTADEKFIYGVTENLNPNTPCIRHVLTLSDTLDSLALKYYGRPDYYWIIADFNQIQDPFEKLLTIDRSYLNIPSLSSITYGGK